MPEYIINTNKYFEWENYYLLRTSVYNVFSLIHITETGERPSGIVVYTEEEKVKEVFYSNKAFCVSPENLFLIAQYLEYLKYNCLRGLKKVVHTHNIQVKNVTN